MTDIMILSSMVMIGSLSIVTFRSSPMQITIYVENANSIEMLYISLYCILREVSPQVYDEAA